MSDKITLEEVKAIFIEEIDKDINDLLERIVQRIYQKGKEDAVKDGDDNVP